MTEQASGVKSPALFNISISNIDCQYIDTFEKYRYREKKKKFEEEKIPIPIEDNDSDFADVTLACEESQNR